MKALDYCIELAKYQRGVRRDEPQSMSAMFAIPLPGGGAVSGALVCCDDGYLVLAGNDGEPVGQVCGGLNRMAFFLNYADAKNAFERLYHGNGEAVGQVCRQRFDVDGIEILPPPVVA